MLSTDAADCTIYSDMLAVSLGLPSVSQFLVLTKAGTQRLQQTSSAKVTISRLTRQCLMSFGHAHLKETSLDTVRLDADDAHYAPSILFV